jgi:hypothetical protein
VWVLDPQKYADAAVHDRYLAPHAGHAGVLLVVLNQVDRLEPETARTVTTDLRRLLDRRGAVRHRGAAGVGPHGDGLPALREELARRVAQRRAASDRLTADVRAAAGGLRPHCGEGGAELAKQERAALTRALSDAGGRAGRRERRRAVGASHGIATRAGRRCAGPPRLRPDPLGPAARRQRRQPHQPPAGEPGASAPPSTTGCAGPATSAGAGLPQACATTCAAPSRCPRSGSADRLDRAVAGTDLGPRPHARCGSGRSAGCSGCSCWRHWSVRCGCSGSSAWATCSSTTSCPCHGSRASPLPTLLLVGGLLAGLLLALLCRPLVAAGARRADGGRSGASTTPSSRSGARRSSCRSSRRATTTTATAVR